MAGFKFRQKDLSSNKSSTKQRGLPPSAHEGGVGEVGDTTFRGKQEAAWGER